MEITQIKNGLEITAVAAHLGIAIGKGDKALCPFHTDKTPSLQFSKEKQIATCFSSNCTAGTMDVIGLTEKKLQKSTHETLQYLAAMMDTDAVPDVVIVTEHTSEEAQQIRSEIFNYFRNGFVTRHDNKGRLYLQSRNLNISKLENLGIVFGYNSSQFHHRGRISSSQMQLCEQVGLLIKSHNGSRTEHSYRAWASHCVVFALSDSQGKITGMYGRSVVANSKSNSKHFYLRNSTGLFYRPSQQASKVILTESIIDFLTLYQIDTIRNNYDFMPIYGVNRLTSDHLEWIDKMLLLEEIIFFFDGDKAGTSAAQKYAEAFKQSRPGVKLSIVNMVAGEDISSLLETHNEAIFSQLLDQRTFLFSPELPSHSVANTITNTEISATGFFDFSDANRLIYSSADFKCIVLGGINKQQLDRMRVTIVIERNPRINAAHVSRQSGLDLYNDSIVDKYLRTTAEKLETDTSKIRSVLSELIEKLEQYRLNNTEINTEIETTNTLTPEQLQHAISFGKQANLMEAINTLIGKSGVVGEEKSRQFLFVAAVSHLMPKPLNIVVQGGSGSGKSYLIKKISHLVPQNKVKRYTRLSEKSFYNFTEHELVNTLVIIEDYDGIGEEAEYALRELQSNGELISGVSVKDEKSGEIKSKDRIVRGPIGSMVATTKAEVYHDNSTRVFFIAVNESEDQTKQIIDYKNKKANQEILEKQEQTATIELQYFVATLQPYQVKNPYLKQMQLPVPNDQLRRLHELFEAFCQQITLIHQHQRQHSACGSYIITQKQDMELAIDLMFDSIVLKVDELGGSLRLFFERLKAYVQNHCKETGFIQREVRHHLQISKTQLQRYINELESLEYIQKTITGSYGAMKYKIVYWDDNQALRHRIKADLEAQLKQL